MENKHITEIELRSEEVQEILTQVPHWMIRWGSVLFLCLFILIMFLSWLIKYPDIINAEAIITTKIPPQKEFVKVSGKVDSLFINDGQKVSKNQPLIIIQNTARYQDVMLLDSIIETLTIDNESFRFPFSEIPILFLGDVESDYAIFENAYVQYNLNRTLQPFLNEAQGNLFSINELESRLQNMRSQKELLSSEFIIDTKDFERNQNLFDKGVISQSEYEEKHKEFLQSQREIKNIVSSISQIKEELSNATYRSKGNKIERTAEKITLLKKVFQSFNQLKKAVKEWKDHYIIIANTDGKVSFSKSLNKNQTVIQGELLFTVIPGNNLNIIAKLKTPAQNSGKIKVGQKVNIKLDNYPETEFGVLRGTVQYISIIPDDNGFYNVEVKLPSTLVTSYKRKIKFKQEMAADAEIITENLRLIERFFYQFKSLFSR